MDDKKLEFAGFVFKDEDEVNAAKKEAAGIEHINSKIDYTDKESLYSVYLKLVKKNLFRTVIGIEFLKVIRNRLIKDGFLEEEVPAVPVVLQSIGEEEKKVTDDIKKIINKKKKKNKEKNEKPYTFKKPFFYSLIIIGVLIAAMVLEIRILGNSENLNIINYQNRLDEEYESWEEDLTERERALNESTLDINYDNIDDTDDTEE